MKPDLPPRAVGTDRGTSARFGNRNRHRKIIPVLILAVFALIVSYNVFPSLRLRIESLLFPEASRATEVCHQAALAGASTPGFARLLSYGKAHEVPQGFYVDSVLIGEMGQGGAEQRFEVTCYIDASGRVVKSHRHPQSKPLEPIGKESEAVGKKLQH